MTRRLVATYVILAAVILAVLEVPLAIVHERGQRHDLQQRVERDAVALAALSSDYLRSPSAAARTTLAQVVERYATTTAVRVVVVNARGVLAADSSQERALGRDFATRPEIIQALAGRVATGQRRSETLDQTLLYVAVPVASGGRVYGAVRASVPTTRLDAQVRRYRGMLLGVAAIVLTIAALLGTWLATWVTTPLARLGAVARRTAEGDLAARADPDAGPPEVRALATTYNDMVARLEQLVDAQVQFVADASHQLRSPLTALRLRIENLQYAGAGDDAEAAIAEVDRLNHLVNGLLALTRADRTSPERRTRALSPIIRERVDAWAPVAEDKGVAVIATGDDHARAHVADGAVEQILDNVISNAVEACPPGGHIAVSAVHDSQGACLRVDDDGPGMRPEARRHAFDRFWRAGDAYEGSGLGLAIVQRLVQADGGEVSVDEAPSGGLRVEVRYPRTEDAARG